MRSSLIVLGIATLVFTTSGCGGLSSGDSKPPDTATGEDSLDSGGEGGGETDDTGDRVGGAATTEGDGSAVLKVSTPEHVEDFNGPDWLRGTTEWGLGTAIWYPANVADNEVHVWHLSESGLELVTTSSDKALFSTMLPRYCGSASEPALKLIDAFSDGGTLADHCTEVDEFVHAVHPEALAPEERPTVEFYIPAPEMPADPQSGEYDEGAFGSFVVLWQSHTSAWSWDASTCSVNAVPGFEQGGAGTLGTQFQLEVSDDEVQVNASGAIAAAASKIPQFEYEAEAMRCASRPTSIVFVVPPVQESE